MRFKDKVAVITGGASGMGLLSGQCYAKEGAKVVLTDINEERLMEKVAEINAQGGDAIGVVADVRVYEQVENVCKKAVEAYGRIDYLLNFAGGASCRICNCNKPYYEYPVEILDWGMEVNLKGPMYFTRAAMPYMVEQKFGVIVVLGSVTGKEGHGGCSVDYATAKSALMNGFVQSVAETGAPHNVRCVAVAPGPVLTRAAMANMHTMLGRAAEPQEIVDLILYLTSEQGSFVTGTCFCIDGGGTRGY